MTFVLGCRASPRDDDGPTGDFGTYRALDGSAGAPLAMDLDRPHAMLIVGKRGYGKSYTVGVLAEELSRFGGVAPVVVDPMGEFHTLQSDSDDQPVPASVMKSPTIAPTAIEPRSWCDLVNLSPESGVGGLVWQAASNGATLAGMIDLIAASDAPDSEKRAATNHLELARSWGVFDADGLTAADLSGPEISILDLSGLGAGPMNAVVRGLVESLYATRVEGGLDRLPWLLFDEAHTFFDGIAESALRRILTRGRSPGVSLVLATQRPSALPAVGVSQADVLVSHRVTSREDLKALERARPTYLDGTVADRMPTDPGEVLVIDDATETAHTAIVRERDTPHGGGSPRASDFPSDSAQSDTESRSGSW